MSPGCAKGVAGSRTTAAALWKGDGVEGPEGAVVREESKAESLFDADRAGQTALLLVQMAMSLAVCKCWPYAVRRPWTKTRDHRNEQAPVAQLAAQGGCCISRTCNTGSNASEKQEDKASQPPGLRPRGAVARPSSLSLSLFLHGADVTHRPKRALMHRTKAALSKAAVRSRDGRAASGSRKQGNVPFCSVCLVHFLFLPLSFFFFFFLHLTPAHPHFPATAHQQWNSAASAPLAAQSVLSLLSFLSLSLASHTERGRLHSLSPSLARPSGAPG